jgi:hypothetical protein
MLVRRRHRRIMVKEQQELLAASYYNLTTKRKTYRNTMRPYYRCCSEYSILIINVYNIW